MYSVIIITKNILICIKAENNQDYIFRQSNNILIMYC